MSLIHIIGNLAFILVACSFMVKDILWLRLLSVTASLCSIIYSSNVAATPLWVPISWNLFFISLNFYHIVKIIYGNRRINLNDIEREVYQTSFPELNLIEFSKLIHLGKWMEAVPGTVLIEEGQVMVDLLLIYNGRVDILIKDKDGDKKVNQLKDGQFIGEMSFLSNKPASATVKVALPTKYISWKQKDLKELVSRNPAIIFSLQSAMGVQMSLAINEKNLL
jgi:hypothetical protein